MGTPKNRSVIKAFALLKSFRDAEEWVSSSELSRRAGLPEASGYRLMQTLEEIGAVARGSKGRYRTGPLLLSLSHNVTLGELLREASQSLMTELAFRLNLTTHLGVLERGMVTYIGKVSPPGAFPVHTRVGAQLEAYCSALGKVLLAALPDEEVESFVLDGELIALTSHTITTTAGLRAELKKVRLAGYAVDDREHQANMRCIAVPVRDREGRVVAALSATDAADHMTPARLDEVRALLLEASVRLRAKLFPATFLPTARGVIAAE